MYRPIRKQIQIERKVANLLTWHLRVFLNQFDQILGPPTHTPCKYKEPVNWRKWRKTDPRGDGGPKSVNRVAACSISLRAEEKRKRLQIAAIIGDRGGLVQKGAAVNKTVLQFCNKQGWLSKNAVFKPRLRGLKTNAEFRITRRDLLSPVRSRCLAASMVGIIPKTKPRFCGGFKRSPG